MAKIAGILERVGARTRDGYEAVVYNAKEGKIFCIRIDYSISDDFTENLSRVLYYRRITHRQALGDHCGEWSPLQSADPRIITSVLRAAEANLSARQGNAEVGLGIPASTHKVAQYMIAGYAKVEIAELTGLTMDQVKSAEKRLATRFSARTPTQLIFLYSKYLEMVLTNEMKQEIANDIERWPDNIDNDFGLRLSKRPRPSSGKEKRVEDE